MEPHRLPRCQYLSLRIILRSNTARRLNAKIRKYLQDYDPNGYGTIVLRKYRRGWCHVAELTRSDTCD